MVPNTVSDQFPDDAQTIFPKRSFDRCRDITDMTTMLNNPQSVVECAFRALNQPFGIRSRLVADTDGYTRIGNHLLIFDPKIKIDHVPVLKRTIVGDAVL